MKSNIENWHIKLFKKSVLKQRKWKKIERLFDNTTGLKCLDIGSDNGVISYLLRQKGGSWVSADLDDMAVASIQSLVETNVYKIDGGPTPFQDDEFDKIIIVDFLEHIPDDRKFIEDMYRILKPSGELIINVPHVNNSLLRKFRLFIGQTDEKHGHLRPGYDVNQIKVLLGEQFRITFYETYSRFFSELIDTFITFCYGLVKNKNADSKTTPMTKGVLVTSSDMDKNEQAFKLYSMIYPVVWIFGKIDDFLFWAKGYMLILKTKSNKNTFTISEMNERLAKNSN